MIGHDVVPHSEANHNNNEIQLSVSNISINDNHSHSDLGHLFEHFQHSSDNKDITHIDGYKLLKSKVIFTGFVYNEIQNQEIWYANLEKQRFRDYTEIAYQNINISSFSLRGPPFI